MRSIVKTFAGNFHENGGGIAGAGAEPEQDLRTRGQGLDHHNSNFFFVFLFLTKIMLLRAGQKLYRLAVGVEKLSKSFGDRPIFRDVTLTNEAGQRVAVVGTNGIGKTTLLRSIVGEIPLTHGTVKWAENAEAAYMPQDNAAAFEEPVTVFDWMRARGKPRDDDQAIRATLGRMLFSRDDMAKTVDKLSGGERGRMLFGEIVLKRPNIILMDEPTNRLDMESIEALNLARELPRHRDLREP